MSSYFHRFELIAAAGFLIGCGERPTELNTAFEKGATDPAAVDADAKITVDSAALHASGAPSDHQRIQGSWHPVTLSTGPEAEDHIVFSGDKISWHVGTKTLEGTFVIDATKQPKRIDLRFPGQKDAPTILLGIYDFKGELLGICVPLSGGLRPTTLEGGKDQTRLLFLPSNLRDKKTAPEIKK
jgi:uncharacterized protein (TIGR03067 family)